MSRGGYLSFLLPCILVGFSFFRAGTLESYNELQLLTEQRVAAQTKLSELRAISVAANIDEKNYQNLVDDFTSLTGLALDEGSRISRSEVTAQVSQLVDLLKSELEVRRELFSARKSLVVKGLSPGDKDSFAPFSSTEFELILEGRFFALPDFLMLVSRLAEEQNCPISLGELEIKSDNESQNPSLLRITLPLRAYFSDV